MSGTGPTLVAGGLLLVLCTLSAMDRSAALGDPASPLLASSGFGVAANRRGVFDALSGKHGELALALATSKVAADPIAPDSAATLGTVRLALGRADPAHAAFTVAANFGWRNVETQLYWLRQAQILGDAEVMAQRADAVLRTAPSSHLLDATLVEMESDPAGRSALAKRLASQPAWSSLYAERARLLGDDEAVDDRAATLRLAVADGMTPDCPSVAAASAGLIAQRRVSAAAKLWGSVCRSNAGAIGGLANGDFEHMTTGPGASPFDWRLTSTGRVRSEIGTAPPPLHGNALGFHSTSSVRETLATQIIILPAGSYRISWSATGGRDRSANAFLVSIGCIGSGPRVLPATPVPAANGRYASDVSIPQGCSAQRLTIAAEPQPANSAAPAFIDDLSIDRRTGV